MIVIACYEPRNFYPGQVVPDIWVTDQHRTWHRVAVQVVRAATESEWQAQREAYSVPQAEPWSADTQFYLVVMD